MTQATEAVLAWLDRQQAESRARLNEWLRIPSVSAQPAHRADCRQAAEWVRGQLAQLGIATEVRDTAGHPVVLGHYQGPPGAPHLLFYGHYDVQPPEPLELWHSPPFEPTVVEGPHGPRVYARGAVDDKGQCLMWIEALRGWHHVTGGLPVSVTVLVEGEEEIGSPSLDPFLAAHAESLRADVAVISDTGMWGIDTPALSTRLRGLVYTQIDLTCASRDLHSGMYGGLALNPLNLLTRILGGLHDAEGRVQIPGFYDDVIDPSPAQKAEWAALGFDAGQFLGEIGLTQSIGEANRSPLERMWSRPTADLNGLWGGYTGEGSKTVIAAEAHAKLSFRLVPGQDPAKVVAGLRAWLNAQLPEDAKAEVQVFGASPAIEVDADSRWVHAARAALAEEYGRPAVLIGCGGSIPVVESMRRLLGLDALLMGFGLSDDQVHSPNEKFELRCFHHGIRSHARLLGRLAGA
jgi:acetylornithine deacetylase/succinyl-diaminopimelate desuccinylase-like protein